MTLGKKPFENIVGKGENAGNQHFLLFLQCFRLFTREKEKEISIFQSLFQLFCCLQVLSILTSLKICHLVNPLPVNKILDQTKLKAFADDKLNVTKMIISVFDRVVQTISHFPTMFSKGFLPRCVKRCHRVGMG